MSQMDMQVRTYLLGTLDLSHESALPKLISHENAHIFLEFF